MDKYSKFQDIQVSFWWFSACLAVNVKQQCGIEIMYSKTHAGIVNHVRVSTQTYWSYCHLYEVDYVVHWHLKQTRSNIGLGLFLETKWTQNNNNTFCILVSTNNNGKSVWLLIVTGSWGELQFSCYKNVVCLTFFFFFLQLWGQSGEEQGWARDVGNSCGEKETIDNMLQSVQKLTLRVAVTFHQH